ncbi:MAG: cell division protein FtsK [Actinobacteria bacterium HGW-Actinobacteria-7]|jgi:S-DNA-T family DNA segregation ATPase FtsK/SpoIIIE|nr:MAG: cell division protein FtsK [Actinobacteria bacterium HGW-Actinobacteria-7]
MARSTPQRSSSKAKAKGGRAAARVEPGMLDDRSKRDIIGVVLSALGVALMIAVMSSRSGFAAGAVSAGLKSAFGVGAFLIPVGLLLWGVSFFVRVEIHEARTGAGLGLCVLSLISLVSLTTPGGEYLASRSIVAAHGGYVGGAVAWALATPTTSAIAAVLLVALLLVGLVVTGLSISGLVDVVREWFAASDSVEPRARGKRSSVERATRTAPIGNGDGADAGAKTAALPRRARSVEDPEQVRKTVPTPRTVAPRAMEGFVLPPLSMLTRTSESAAKHKASDNELKITAGVITETLATFDIPARVVSWMAGPTVTLFEVEIAKGVRLNRVTALADDLALALASSTVRIMAPIPGKALVGIEVPNIRRSSVTLGDVLVPSGEGGPLLLGIGKDVAGDGILADLAVMPHLLIGGTTGSGKSVAINAMLMSIIMRSTPSEVRLILIDPKRVELSLYNGVPHLYVPVVTEPKEAASSLAWAVTEMERRLKVLQVAGARNIGAYNAMVQDGKGPEGGAELPYLVIVIDELADLMMVAAKEVEESICRIAQLARAAGIHLIVATQRPEANVVTGLIKANITNRIAFNVASAIDSRVVLDQPGAEKLVGLGDMLFSTPAWPKPKRIQGCYVAESEIEAIVEHLKQQSEPDYHEEILHLKVSSVGGGVDTGDDDDPLIWEAADIVVTSGLGSTSLLQRRLKVGYARAGRIMDMLESKGVVGPPDGSKPREVLCDIEDLESLKVFEREEAEGL